jgi:hypothetical protein
MIADASHTFLYVETDVPAGVRLTAWRTAKARAARRRERRRRMFRPRFA